MKNLMISVFALLLAFGPLAAQDLGLYEKQEYRNYGATLPYRILWPKDMKQGVQYPLVLNLHGMGNRGGDNEKQLSLGGGLFVRATARNKYPAIVLYPQAPESSAFVRIKEGAKALPGGWQKFTDAGMAKGDLSVELTIYGEMVKELLRQLIDAGSVDVKRIYLTGVSMGGFTAYKFIADDPDLFAGAIIMAAGTPLPDIDKWAGKTPVWIHHGAGDKVVPVDAARAVVKILKERKVANYKYSEYPDVAHGCWVNAFADPDYLPWLFSKSKE